MIRLADKLPPNSPDPLVAAYASCKNAVLIGSDGDFNNIAPRLPKGARRRFRKLSRIHLAVPGPTAHVRMAAAMSFIEFEWAESAKSDNDGRRIWIAIQPAVIKTNR